MMSELNHYVRPLHFATICCSQAPLQMPTNIGSTLFQFEVKQKGILVLINIPVTVPFWATCHFSLLFGLYGVCFYY